METGPPAGEGQTLEQALGELLGYLPQPPREGAPPCPLEPAHALDWIARWR